MGIETGDNEILIKSGKGIEGAGMFYKAAKTLFENGIRLTPSYVLGLPGENKHSLHNTIKHAQILKELSISVLGYPPGEIVANLLEPLPGSNAFKILEDAFPYKYLNEDVLERVHINRNVRIAKRIYRITRQFFAGILYVFQEKLTKLCGKFAARRTLSVYVNTR